MAERIDEIINLSGDTALGRIVAVNVSEEDYMRDYAENFHEWVGGIVYKMSPVSLKHNDLSDYIKELLKTYFALRSVGRVASAPFVMKVGKSRREPDLQVILKDSKTLVKETFTDGAADICIEIISPANEGTDYGDKLREYEEGGVREYWIVDPQRQESRFHRLNSEGVYKTIATENDVYTTPLLPDFQLDTRILWRLNLPNLLESVEIVKQMLEKAE
jgi:Uma2 family endonuclease